MLIWNLKPERWPAGAPQRIVPGTVDRLFPLYGLDENGKHISDQAFTDIDGSPSKSFIVEHNEDEDYEPYFFLATGKRPEFELFHTAEDPFCLQNLTGDPRHEKVEREMKEALLEELVRSKDPRIVGPDKEVFDTYLRYSPMREFPDPGASVSPGSGGGYPVHSDSTVSNIDHQTAREEHEQAIDGRGNGKG